jgi:bifunctional DNase/RNase
MKISGLLDTTNSFIIKKMLLGLQRLHKRVDSRRPITIDLLMHIFDALQYTCSSVVNIHLLTKMQ